MTDLSFITADFKDSDISYVGLFGSRAKGDATHDSDYDFLIEFEPNKKYTMFDLSNLKGRLEKKLGASVDLVTTNAIHPYMKKNILSTVQVLYDTRS
ncbi:MAG: nucleotidyltransferase family protein [bacterium]|nr:nucleotidyltransferase family protein [bacterium]